LSKKTLISFILVSIILMIYGSYIASAQNQLPLVPPYIIWGKASIDNKALTSSNNDKIISAKAARLLVLFLDNNDSQTIITNIINELNSGTTTTLNQQFLNSDYCVSRNLVLTNASVTKISASEWQIRANRETYTVLTAQISYWNGSSWVSGKKLEVYWHNGLLDDYRMGEINTNNYVLEIPLYPSGITWGSGTGTYNLLDPGKVKVGDNILIYIDNVLATTPQMPVNIGSEAFRQMDINAPSEIPWEYVLGTGWSLMSYGVTKCYYEKGNEPTDVPNWVEKVEVVSLKDWFSSVLTPNAGTASWKTVYGPRGVLDINLIANSMKYVSPNEGYWVFINKSSNGAVMNLKGKAFNSLTMTIPLTKGWNQIGFPLMTGYYDTPTPPNIELPKNAVWAPRVTGMPAAKKVFLSIWDKVLMINSDQGFYNPILLDSANSMRFVAPGQGLWIKVSQDCELQYP